MSEQLMKVMDDINSGVGRLQEKQANELKAIRDENASLLDRIEQIEAAGTRPTKAVDGENREVKNAVEKFYRRGDRGDLERVTGVKAADMQIDNTHSGSYTHVPDLDRQILAAVGANVEMFKDVRKVQTDRNQYDQLFTTIGPGASRAAEGGSRAATTAPYQEKVSVTLYDLYAYVSVSNELLDASNFNIAAYLQAEVERQFTDTIETEIVSGSGSTESLGILTQATSSTADDHSPLRSFSLYQYVAGPGVSSPIGSDFSYNNLVDLVAALATRYRRGAKFYMSTDAISVARKLIGTDGQPVWKDASGGVAGMTQSLMGYPVVEAPALPSVAADALPVVFGDLMQAFLWVSHSRGMRVIRDQVTAPGQTKFYFSMQCCGKPADTRAAKVLKIAAS